MWNSRGDWKKYQRLIVGGIGIVGVVEKIVAVRGGGRFNCFFLPFSNHENYSIKNICVYSKSKTETKVTNKQNLEHFKMRNRRLFILKFCNNSKMLLSFSWAISIRALLFSFSLRAYFYSSEHLCFSFLLIFRFILI